MERRASPLLRAVSASMGMRYRISASASAAANGRSLAPLTIASPKNKLPGQSGCMQRDGPLQTIGNIRPSLLTFHFFSFSPHIAIGGNISIA